MNTKKRLEKLEEKADPNAGQSKIVIVGKDEKATEPEAGVIVIGWPESGM